MGALAFSRKVISRGDVVKPCACSPYRLDLVFPQGFIAFAGIESKTALADANGWQNTVLGPALNGAARYIVSPGQIVGGDKPELLDIRCTRLRS